MVYAFALGGLALILIIEIEDALACLDGLTRRQASSIF